ncbi:MAG TPA: aldehyde dehydrogenase family protein, partial [Puia sp.]|nr:aldehyde dehydrogenase family protein [Puia sp.]
IKKLKQGNPLEAGITTGPVARRDLADHLKAQLDSSVHQGARLILGGGFNQCNVEPALITGLKKGMAAFDEETFGPLAAIATASDEADAIRLANDSNYGLGAAIWTKDLERGLALAKKIESGSVFINALVKSDPRLPFGGIKHSGYGRELGVHGVREFVNIKTISAATEA